MCVCSNTFSLAHWEYHVTSHLICEHSCVLQATSKSDTNKTSSSRFHSKANPQTRSNYKQKSIKASSNSQLVYFLSTSETQNIYVEHVSH